MLAHRLRRWTNIGTALGECPVFSGIPAPRWTIRGQRVCVALGDRRGVMDPGPVKIESVRFASLNGNEVMRFGTDASTCDPPLTAK